MKTRDYLLFFAGAVLGMCVLGSVWLISNSQQEDAREKSEVVSLQRENFKRFCDLMRDVIPGSFPGVGEKQLVEALEAAQKNGGVPPQAAADAMLIEAAGSPLSPTERINLMKWVTLGRKQRIPRPSLEDFRLRRERYDAASRNRRFSEWLSEEWEGWRNLSGGGNFRSAEFDTLMVLCGARPETVAAVERDETVLSRGMKEPFTARGLKALIEARKNYEETVAAVEAAFRETRSPGIPLDIAPARKSN